jgi:hypothetical protein
VVGCRRRNHHQISCAFVYIKFKAEQQHMGPSHSHNVAIRRVSLVQGKPKIHKLRSTLPNPNLKRQNPPPLPPSTRSPNLLSKATACSTPFLGWHRIICSKCFRAHLRTCNSVASIQIQRWRPFSHLPPPTSPLAALFLLHIAPSDRRRLLHIRPMAAPPPLHALLLPRALPHARAPPSSSRPSSSSCPLGIFFCVWEYGRG